jgi:hypothetical protein
MKDALALAVAAIWLALNIALWVMHLPDLVQFACSVVLGVAFFAGFFVYLGYGDRQNAKRCDD